ncbi:hypothetical protein [Paenibacillus azoreducens]|uniref:Uncharacterized protein n=1 Tax=Paenibacillus azoreducens TaxID=116718 RepID=A0A919YEQ6_9BACL|nr:hypothetical protein [Paenibacillus azoreducens]GIO47092.1 hypothetical protein J34TS1_18570 [Paenibacillus azoreducens]
MSSTNFNQIAKVYNLKGGYSNEIGSMIVNFINTQINRLNVDSCLEFGAGTGLVTEHVNGFREGENVFLYQAHCQT